MCNLVNLKQDGLYQDLQSFHTLCWQLNEAIKTLPHVKSLIVQTGTVNASRSSTSQVDRFKFILDVTPTQQEALMFVFFPFFKSKASIKPCSHVFHFLSQMKTLTPGLLAFGIHGQINVNKWSAGFHRISLRCSRTLRGLLGGIEPVCNKWGRWKVKYLVLRAKEKIIKTNDGYPPNPTKHVCYFHSWG